ncbi:MAG: hypothetical protein FJ271_33615 [Planctomycetes bacterium]|nr:hypothetical protein [Planctomycetota bacterium]
MTQPLPGPSSAGHTDTAPKETLAVGMLQPWTVGELPLPPPAGWRRWLSVIGPGVLLAGASIGSGEWLTGPGITAQYGATLLWLATLSILGQVFVNIEMIRYTLYCGEPIVVGFFRSWPGPRLWTWVYAFLDVAAIWPFNVASAGVALAAAFLGHLPGDSTIQLAGVVMSESTFVRWLSFILFLLAFVPLIFGGTIYKMLVRIFTIKLVIVLVYLSVFAVLTVSATNAWDVFTGFFRFGAVPLRAETVIADRHFTLVERDGQASYLLQGTMDKDEVEVIAFRVTRGGETRSYTLADLPADLKAKRAALIDKARARAQPGRFFVRDSRDDTTLTIEGTIAGDAAWNATEIRLASGGQSRTYRHIDDVPAPFIDVVRNLVRFQGLEEVNAVSYWRDHGRLPALNWALLATLVAIAGAGGLTNTLFSSFARDKGWGMGARVGAIPSLVGGMTIALSHVGEAFRPDDKSRPRWRRWMRYIVEDQLVVWMICNFIGMALPCMLSLEFIRAAPVSGNRVAAMTAEGMAHRYPEWSTTLWLLTLGVGFLILFPGQILSGDMFARRWTDIIWSCNPQAQRLHGNQVKYVYYGILLLYAIWGTIALWLFDPLIILQIGGVLMNLAMGFSALHTLYVNRTLLPRELQPNWLMQAGVLFCGVFFLGVTVVVVLMTVR